jgi:tRNA wybutosine-synthesizing protein 4
MALAVTKAGVSVVGTLSDPELQRSGTVPRPLIVGSGMAASSDGDITIMGGGGTCFSMGTYWTPGTYSFKFSAKSQPTISAANSVPLKYHSNFEFRVSETQPNGNLSGLSIVQVPKIKISSEDDFRQLLHSRKPAIIEGLDLGSCMDKWDAGYLIGKVGKDRKVGKQRHITL